MDETVTTCSGCGSLRYCRRYEDMWLCTTGKSHCWRRRKVIHSKRKFLTRRLPMMVKAYYEAEDKEE